MAAAFRARNERPPEPVLSTTSDEPVAVPPAIRYLVEIADRNRHQFRVELTLQQPLADQCLSLPVWVPGSYLVREFSRHLSALQARQGRRILRVEVLAKNQWRIVGCRAGTPLQLSYRVYAFDTSVRAAFLDAERGFFNGTSVLLCAPEQAHQAHRLALGALPEGWQVATAMRPVAGAANEFEAADYDELVDHPVELGAFWRGQFDAQGVAHEFVVADALPTFDSERLLNESQRICAAQIRFWHGDAAPPFERYVFLLNASSDGRGGLEHRASTALAAPRRDLPRIGVGGTVSDAHVDLLGLISHEYFHTWNVKRLKPAELARIAYDRENHTELLWFFEGFTSYYDDLMLIRSGLIDPARYLGLLAKSVNQVLTTPGRFVQSVAAASFDAWIKYYRVDENTPNATVSYYAKGALVALAFDLTLRSSGRRGASLDAVMRRLWQASGGGAITEADIADALAAIGGRSYADEIEQWVHGTADLPLPALLAAVGVDWRSRPASAAAALGLRLAEGPVTGITVQSVLAGSDADRAGVCAGDELLAVSGWRIRRFDELRELTSRGQAFELLLVRNQRLRSVEVLPDEKAPLGSSVELRLAERCDRASQARRRAWLNG